MNKNKTTSVFLSVVIFLAVFSSASEAQNVELTKLGSSSFTVDPDSLTAGYSQTSTSLTFTSFSAGSNYLGGLLSLAPLNWTAYTLSPYTGFALNMSISGSNPNTDFSINFYTDSGLVATYTGVTTGLTSSLSLVDLSLAATDSGDYGAISAIDFTWNGELAAPNTVTVESVYAVVPEPSTYALLAMSALGLGGYVIRRRRS